MFSFQQQPRPSWNLFFAPLLILLAAASYDNQDITLSQQHSLRTAVSTTHESWSRYLQSCNIQTDEDCSTNVQAVCDFFNADNSSSVGACECSRFGRLDTKVLCAFLDDCNDANATESCFTGTVERIFNPQLLSQTVETCVTFPQSETPAATTCIRTFPNADGNFLELDQCTVQYSSTGVDKRLCNECTICPTVGGSSSAEPVMPEISFNCCNLQPDLKQSCSAVTEDGVGIPIFDPIIEPGTCVSAGSSVQVVWAATIMGAAATAMLWI